jgi:uncharacterized protein with PIN domain
MRVIWKLFICNKLSWQATTSVQEAVIVADIRNQHNLTLAEYYSSKRHQWNQTLSSVQSEAVISEIRRCHQCNQKLSSVQSEAVISEIRRCHQCNQKLSSVKSEAVISAIRSCHQCNQKLSSVESEAVISEIRRCHRWNQKLSSVNQNCIQWIRTRNYISIVKQLE